MKLCRACHRDMHATQPVVLCPMCEIRTPERGCYCRPCFLEVLRLQAYWRSKGMGLRGPHKTRVAA